MAAIEYVFYLRHFGGIIVKIVVIDEDSPHLSEVIELGKINSGTLGFFPKGAYRQHAAQERIIVALDDSDRVLGYLLYAETPTKMLVYIVHLCVQRSERNKGVARSLFEELKQRTKDKFRGIRVRCRRDYAASTLWPKLGFIARSERAGRSKQGSNLTVWWFDHEHRSLFTYAAEQRTQSKHKVVIDANVFYQLEEASNPANEESKALLADWLKENIDLCLTVEIYNEIHRNDDEAQRKQRRTFTEQFQIVQGSDSEFQKVQQALFQLFPHNTSESDASDFRQLSRAIADNVQFFVTRDEPLLKKADHIYAVFGIRIMRPSDLIIHQDELIREAEYQPARLAGSHITIELVHSGQSSFLEQTFRVSQEEPKSHFRQQLQLYLTQPHAFETFIVRDGDNPLALFSYGRQNERELEISLIRFRLNSLTPTLAKHLILKAVLDAFAEKRIVIRVTDARLSDVTVDALQENGFIFAETVWTKVILRGVQTAIELAAQLEALSQRFPHISRYFQDIKAVLGEAHDTNNGQVLLKTERLLWPVKITDLDLPAFVVPIRPEWAMHLFDPDMASQTLFGSDPSLMFKTENVYYRTSRPTLPTAPARILWYVSKGIGQYQNTMSIRACSYVDEVIIDKPKHLFSRFKRLGVYEWADIYKLANNDIEQEIMAFRFSNTELLNPIGRDDLQKVWEEEVGRNFHVQAPLRISNELFCRLYMMGISDK